MLPFLKPKIQQGVISISRKSDGTDMVDDDQDSGLNACAADLIRAIHAKDESGVASAFRAAFELLENEPHSEVDHEDSSNNEDLE